MSAAYCFDLDGTITTTEILPCIASELDVTDEIATLTQLTMDGHVPFTDSMRLRSLILGQVPIERVHAIIDAIPLDPRLVNFINERPEQCFIVTGNLNIWVKPMARRLACKWICSRARTDSTRIRIDHILDKGEAIKKLRSSGKFDRYIAIGDGANDEPMFAQADLAIAYGGVHVPAPTTTLASHLIINSSETLCSLLKAL